MTRWPPRLNPEPPADLEDAVRGYKRFTTFEPQEFGHLEGLVVPDQLMCIGEAVHVIYRSDKWEDKNHDYIHKHEKGVKVYVPEDSMIDEGPFVSTPSFIKRDETTLYIIGPCLGFRYRDDRGKKIDATSKPHPELYSIPSGKALLIIEVHDDVARLAAAIWGGKLDVTADGIEG